MWTRRRPEEIAAQAAKGEREASSQRFNPLFAFVLALIACVLCAPGGIYSDDRRPFSWAESGRWFLGASVFLYVVQVVFGPAVAGLFVIFDGSTGGPMDPSRVAICGECQRVQPWSPEKRCAECGALALEPLEHWKWREGEEPRAPIVAGGGGPPPQAATDGGRLPGA